MTASRIFALLFAFGLVSHCARANATAALHIAQGIFTDSVKDNGKTLGRIIGTPSQERQIYLWMKFRGSKDLLDTMQNDPKGQVRIRHIWRRYRAGSLHTEFTKTLTIGAKSDLQKIVRAVGDFGYFEWRTNSLKAVSPGDWRVDVELENGAPILCIDANGQTRACSFPIRIQ